MDEKIKKLLLQAAKSPEKRSSLFYEVGQSYLKPLFDRQLEEATYQIFQYLLENIKSWKSDLMIPLYYKTDKQKDVFKDIWFTVRDYLSWCILYPQEVEQYFMMDESGKVLVKENPKIRILDKDNKKDVYKTELGQRILTQVKKERDTLIASGFTLGQKDSILTVCLVGLMVEHKSAYKKPEIKKINYKPQEKNQAKEIVKDVLKQEQKKLTIKEVNEVAQNLLIRYRNDLSFENAQKEIINYLKGKDA